MGEKWDIKFEKLNFQKKLKTFQQQKLEKLKYLIHQNEFFRNNTS